MSKRMLWLRLIVISITGMVIFISLFSAFRFVVSAFEIEIALKIFDHGFTDIIIPPVGRVRAQTHFPPILFQVTLLNVNLEMLSMFISETESGRKDIEWLAAASKRYIYLFIARSLAVAFLGGVAGAFLLYRKPCKKLILGGLIGFLIFSLLLFFAVITYDADAFKSPEFEGILSAAPWLLGLVEETIVSVRTLGEQLEVITSNLLILFERLENLGPLGVIGGEIKVLHVSDIHNNPAAFDFINQVIRTFDVDLVIDTGDITDYGTPLEAELASRVSNFPVPYVLVPGNHDSPQVIESLKRAGVYVLLEGIIEVAGLRIAGIADPSSASTAMAVKDEATYHKYIERLEEIIASAAEKPHIIASHHPKIASAFKGRVPILLMGHTHRTSIEIEEDLIAINAGTSGAAGIRGLQAKAEIPYSVVLLYFNLDENEKPVAVAADFIRVYKIQGSFILERHVLIPAP